MTNITTIQGRLVADPEIKTYNRNGQEGKVARFRLAVDRRGRDAGADFFNCSGFNGTAEMLEKYVHKGDMIIVNGRLQQDSYTDRDGQKRTSVSVIANEINFCGGKKDNADGNAAPAPAAAANDFGDDNDLPF